VKRRAAIMVARPTELRIVTYQVGFGDCFLLSFRYPKAERHVLVDFGSTCLPKGAPRDQMLRVANDIAARTRGKLHAIVATHRHADHVSGFASQKKGDPGDVIRGLRPDVIIQPWTEDPDAKRDAREASPGKRGGHAIARHVRSLEAMQEVAEAVTAVAGRMRKAIDFGVADELAFLGDDNKLSNRPAVENLMKMAKKGGNRYVHFGSKSGLESVLPGVKVHVLGPPTLKQTATIEKQRAKDPVEFWQFWGHQAAASGQLREGGGILFPKAVVKGHPQYARWLRRRLTEVHAESLLQLVRILDAAMNNTSVILLFEVGGKRLLFPGDAQIENWQYALSHAWVRKLVGSVDVYKVGHHGSLNATPKKALWPLFKKKGAGRKKRMQTLVSTLAGKHGHVDRGTEVPRTKLVRALKSETQYFTTESLKTGELCEERVLKLGG